MADLASSAFLVFGAAFVLLGSLGLVKFPDTYTRLHAPTKATTLGVGSILVASAIDTSVREPGLSVHELLIILFLFLTAPISAYLIARAALHLGVDSGARPPGEPTDGSQAPPGND